MQSKGNTTIYFVCAHTHVGMYVCVYMGFGAFKCHSTQLKSEDIFQESTLSLCGSQGLNAGCQPWQQVLLSDEPSHQPCFGGFELYNLKKKS